MNTDSTTAPNTIQTTTSTTLRIRYMTTTAIFAAMITVMTAYICHIPVGANGGYIHLGDSLIYLAAALLPTPYAIFAASIGGGMADLLTAPVYAPATIVIKALLTLAFTSKSARIVNVRNILSTVVAFAITVVGYYLFEALLFGSKAAFITSVTGNTLQSVGSVVVFIILGLVLDKMGFKKRFLS